MINELNKRCLNFTFNDEKKSIDQSMITYFANHSSKKRLNNKPNRLGCKIWVLAEACSCVVQFKSYQDVKFGSLQRHVAV